eukprot:scaffold282216_cov13-Prasinocladus_malaysianus.AAC.1
MIPDGTKRTVPPRASARASPSSCPSPGRPHLVGPLFMRSINATVPYSYSLYCVGLSPTPQPSHSSPQKLAAIQ